MMKWEVVPYTGTGDFKNRCGVVEFRSGPAKKFPIIFDYNAEEAG